MKQYIYSEQDLLSAGLLLSDFSVAGGTGVKLIWDNGSWQLKNNHDVVITVTNLTPEDVSCVPLEVIPPEDPLTEWRYSYNGAEPPEWLLKIKHVVEA